MTTIYGYAPITWPQVRSYIIGPKVVCVDETLAPLPNMLEVIIQALLLVPLGIMQSKPWRCLAWSEGNRAPRTITSYLDVTQVSMLGSIFSALAMHPSMQRNEASEKPKKMSIATTKTLPKLCSHLSPPTPWPCLARQLRQCGIAMLQTIPKRAFASWRMHVILWRQTGMQCKKLPWLRHWHATSFGSFHCFLASCVVACLPHSTCLYHCCWASRPTDQCHGLWVSSLGCQSCSRHCSGF